MVCREISCGAPLDEMEVLNFGEAHDLAGVKTSCLGNETSVSQCTFQEVKGSCVDATVVCTSETFSVVYLHIHVNTENTSPF